MDDIGTVYVVTQLEPSRAEGPQVRAVCASLGSAEQYIRRESRRNPDLKFELDVSEILL